MKKNEPLLPLVTPGEILEEEFLKPLGITEYRLAQDIGVPRVRINAIVRGTRTSSGICHRAITADTAVRLAQYFGNSAQFWLNLQNDYELRKMERDGARPVVKIFEGQQKPALPKSGLKRRLREPTAKRGSLATH